MYKAKDAGRNTIRFHDDRDQGSISVSAGPLADG
jgi:hypothetical protein